MVCGGLKILCMLLGQQHRYTKLLCSICDWESPAQQKHWTQRQWTQWTKLIPGSKHILKKSLVDPEKGLQAHTEEELSGSWKKYLTTFTHKVGFNQAIC
jgi:hypothetical protein